MNPEESAYTIAYEFRFKDGQVKTFTIVLDPVCVSLIGPEPMVKPAWTRLETGQCACCPLTGDTHPHCPIAVNIAELVDEFKDSFSYDECEVVCITPERTYLKKTLTQEGLYSILGIIMATSDCPVMDFYKPMARFHLPFASVQETIFRSSAVYLLQQYFGYKRGQEPDLEMKKLEEHHNRVMAVNAGILERIRSVVKKDADNNAIIILNSFAQMFSMEIEDSLVSLEHLFPSKGECP